MRALIQVDLLYLWLWAFNVDLFTSPFFIHSFSRVANSKS
jgi:hypothetical protein